MLRAAAWVKLALFAVLALSQTMAQAAMPAGWVAAELRGTVVCLEGGEWQEFDRGGKLRGGETLRTLRSGRLVLKFGDQTISLGGNTAIRLGDGSGGATTVTQYSGTLVVDAGREAPQRIAIETPALAMATGDGLVSVTVDGGTARITVESGTVTVVDRVHGHKATLAAGQVAIGSAEGMSVGGAGELPAIFDGNGNVIPDATTSAAAALQTDGSASEDAGSSGNKDKNGSDNGNNGNGNGGNNGSENGKAKGKDKDKDKD